MTVETKPTTTIRFHRILLTGAAGGVGTQLRPRLKAYCDVLRVSDVVESLPAAGEGEERFVVNLADKAAVFKMVEGCDTILHLGGVSVEKTWEEILQGNIVGLVNLYEAARQYGVKRIIFASSNHVVGFYRQDQVINSRDPPKPDGFYGLSKAFGEDLAQLYWDKHGIETVSVRIGSIFPKPTDRRMLATWMSYDDAERLFMAAMTAPLVGHSIIFGMSDNKTVFWDNTNAKHIGYRPKDSSDVFRDEVEAKFQKLDLNDVATRYQGAAFTRTGPFFQDDGLGGKKA
ncbi:NAD-dependent epimerase/dehydratase [Gonapodya prolifera JEL478]|uniref:NAD-dependent epimerase/dehydratase n=1 Tax=Gonapodya prolifera (strain JEL478) TaxID=1344416 RepID=A0A139ARS4_GONPJ|nr:NAD-dependent epimerase/dehydratase [Gonapodya prolifera JEL478]|eukprot:KXS19451.1 NAD-dependent epimerase/dehydratase [Gonapodya prolifera JEL478]